jgi:hypothetical protein
MPATVEQPPAPDTKPDAFRQRLFELYRELMTRERLCEQTHETYKNARELFEATKQKILDEIDAEQNGALPMFDGRQGEDWRVVPLTEALAGVPAVILKKLADAELSTVGQLADYTASGKMLIELAGIGSAKAEEVERALENFWERRKEADKQSEEANGEKE